MYFHSKIVAFVGTFETPPLLKRERKSAQLPRQGCHWIIYIYIYMCILQYTAGFK